MDSHVRIDAHAAKTSNWPFRNEHRVRIAQLIKRRTGRKNKYFFLFVFFFFPCPVPSKQLGG